MTGWQGHQVLYFGDHPYSDLADVTLEHGWRTGAIIKELTVNLQCIYNLLYIYVFKIIICMKFLFKFVIVHKNCYF